MNTFAKASKIKLRFNTAQGVLSVEQLWDLSQAKLAVIIKNLREDIKAADINADSELAFLDQDSNQVDKILQLKFDVAKEVWQINQEEMEAAKNKAANKEHNQKILEIIKKKQDSDLEGKSIEELKALLKE
jgi:hypothetical protein